MEFIQSNKVDILLTDIKMPHMDGLDLIDQARSINDKLNVVIFSAYGEFDYARRAMDNRVLKYILKPIDPGDFYNVLSSIIRTYEEELYREEMSQKIILGYNKSLIYEKEKLFTDLINGATLDDAFLKQVELSGMSLNYNTWIMILLDVDEKFFDSRNETFSALLTAIINCRFEYINLNEYQSVIFLMDVEPKNHEELLKNIGEKLNEAIKKCTEAKTCIVFSGIVFNAADLCREYR